MTQPGLLYRAATSAAAWCVLVAATPGHGLEALVTWSDSDVTLSQASSRISTAQSAPGVDKPPPDPSGTDSVSSTSRTDHSDPSIRRWDRLREGDRIELRDGRKVSLLCSTDHWVELRGAATWQLTPKACAAGRPLDLGTYRRLTPRAGRYVTEKDTPILRRFTRSGALRAVPLSPRGSVVEARPTLEWRALHDADSPEAEYTVRVTGMPRSIRLPVADLDCRPSVHWDDVVCRAPWPTSHPGITKGQRLTWELGFRPSLTAPLRLQHKKPWVKRLSTEAATELHRNLDEIAALPLDEVRRALLRAGLYVEHRLYTSALEAYRWVGGQGDVDGPVDADALAVALGDIYLKMGLAQFAMSSYAAASEARDPAVRAAAAAGRARVLERRGAFGEAAAAWRRAQALYATTDWAEAAAAAQAKAVAAEQNAGRSTDR